VSQPLRAAQLAVLVAVVGAVHACAGSPSSTQRYASDAQPVAEDAGQVPAPEASSPGSPIIALPEVQLAEGTLLGKSEGKTRMFLGIPYAAPPLGALRFARPVSPPPFGRRSAAQFGAQCPQSTAEAFLTDVPLAASEDCLYLNVYTPDDARPDDLRPVLVFVHGGGGLDGSGASYDARALSEAGGAVVVTINYRLGLLASLVHEALDAELGHPSGNLSIHDQQHALRWVRDHIASFGGDPTQVTLFGQSQGGNYVCVHMFARGSEGLARRYIMESGACVESGAPELRATNLKSGASAVASLCPGALDVVGCLRGLGPAEFVTWQSSNSNANVYVDGDVLSDKPLALLRAGKVQRGEVILGSNEHELRFLENEPWRAKRWPILKNTAEFGIVLAAAWPLDSPDVVLRYGLPPNDEAANSIFVRIATDAGFRCPARFMARELHAQGVPVYLYSFGLDPAVHIQELDYVFGWAEGRVSRLFAGASVPANGDLLTAMQGYWLDFARTGDPNGAGRVVWPRYTKNADEHMHLAERVSVESKLSQADCDMWDRILVTEPQPSP
jgi:para-nitrobenzyl esterase